jgi:hypothetical protein
MDGLEFLWLCGDFESQRRIRLLHSVLCALAPALLLPVDVPKSE